jgi:hypothetical protein
MAKPLNNFTVMKNALYFKMLLLFAAFIFILTGAYAQENKTGKVILKIEKEGKTVVDTVFDLKEGQDPEDLKETISHLTGEDMIMFPKESGGQNIIVMQKHGTDMKCHMEHMEMDSADKECIKKKVMVFEEEEGKESHDCKMIHELGIDIDSLREAHGGAKVIVLKDDEGNITTKVLEEDVEWVSEDKEGEQGEKTYKIIITDEGQQGEDEEVYILKTDDGKKVKVITEKSVVVSSVGEDEEGTVKVIVIGDDEEKTEKDVKVTVKVLDEDEEGAGNDNDKKVKEEGRKKK